MKFNEPVWVADFRRFIGLEVRLLDVRKGVNADYYEYGVFSPNGIRLLRVASYNNSDHIGSGDGPFCGWSAEDTYTP